MTMTIQRRSSLRQTLRSIAAPVCAIGMLAAAAAAMAGGAAVEPIMAKQLSDERTRFTDSVSIEIRLQPEGREELIIALDDPSDVSTGLNQQNRWRDFTRDSVSLVEAVQQGAKSP